MKALIFLNPTAHRGLARRRLAQVAQRLSVFDAETLESTGDELRDTRAIEQAIDDGFELLIAAGGDGTVHQLVNALWTIRDGEPPDGIVVGAVGLGSSNDFHKPTDEPIPCRLDVAAATKRDVVLTRFGDGQRERLFLASASVGVTAAANDAFNREDRVLSVLKRVSTAAAIPWAAVRTILTFGNMPAEIRIDGERIETELSNLSLLKTPFVSGALRFDVDVVPDDATIAVTLCEKMSRSELLRTMVALYRGRFRGRPNTRVWQTGSPVEVRLETCSVVELDGEIYRSSSAHFELRPGWLTICGI